MDFVATTAAITSLAALLVWLTLRVRQSSVVAYLLLGVLAGPVFKVVETGKTAEQLADIGLVMLLFFVGLEFDVKGIVKFARFAVPATALQIGLTTAAIAGLGAVLGFTPL